METRLDRAWFNCKSLRGLRRVHPHHIPKVQNFGIGRGQLGESATHDILDALAIRAVVTIDRPRRPRIDAMAVRVEDGQEFFDAPLLPPVTPPQDFKSNIDGDPEEPGGNPCPAVKLMNPRKCNGKRLLHRITGIVFVAGYPLGHGEQFARFLTNQRLCRVRIAAPKRFHQIALLRRRVEIGCTHSTASIASSPHPRDIAHVTSPPVPHGRIAAL